MTIWKMNFCSRFLRLSFIPRFKERPQISMVHVVSLRFLKALEYVRSFGGSKISKVLEYQRIPLGLLKSLNVLQF